MSSAELSRSAHFWVRGQWAGAEAGAEAGAGRHGGQGIESGARAVIREDVALGGSEHCEEALLLPREARSAKRLLTKHTREALRQLRLLLVDEHEEQLVLEPLRRHPKVNEGRQALQ